MGEAKRSKLRIARAIGAVSFVSAPIAAGPVRNRVGTFGMVASSAGQPRRIRVEFPQVLTTQEKYDVATALCKVAAELVAEADEERDAPKRSAE